MHELPSLRQTKERLGTFAAGISESAQIKAATVAQVLPYSYLVRENYHNGMSKSQAVIQPLINLFPGAMDPDFTVRSDISEYFYPASQLELQAYGAGIIIRGGIELYKQRRKADHGELPLSGDNAVLFLNIDGLPVSQAVSDALTLYSKHERNNVNYAELYEGESRPEKPKGAFRRWYTEQVNFGADATDTDVIKRTGALEAPCVIISTNDHDILDLIALSIQIAREEKGLPLARILPLPAVPFEADEPIVYQDRDLGMSIEIAERPINPYRTYLQRVEELVGTDTAKQEEALETFTRNVPLHRRMLRQKHIRNKLQVLEQKRQGGKIKLHFNGDDQYQKRHLLHMTDTDVFETVPDPDEADVVITYGESGITEDRKINFYSQQISHSSDTNDPLHLFLTFSKGNEDNASFVSDGGSSIQTMIADELRSRVEKDVRFSPKRRTRLKQRVFSFYQNKFK